MPQGYFQNNYPNYSNAIMTVFVDGEAGARSYPVASGNTVMLIDFNSGTFWLKSTDQSGVPQMLRTFKFKEEITQSVNQNANVVSREEFNQLNAKIDKLISELGGVK